MLITSWVFLSYFGLTYATGKYTLHKKPKNYADARSECTSLGSRLVKVNSNAVFQDMVDLTYGKSTKFWIGLTLDDTRPPTDSSYKYEDGEPASFYKWKSDEPDHQLEQQCIRAWYDGGPLEYKTKDCSSKYDFVCERIDVTTAEATTTDDSEMSSSTLSTSTTIEPSSSSSESPSAIIEPTSYSSESPSTTLEPSSSSGESPTTHTNFHSTSTAQTYRACVCEMSVTWGTTQSNVTSDRLEEIRSALKVDKKSLSSTKRKLVSAGDGRQSSNIIGYGGAIFLAFAVFVIVVGDIVKIIKWASIKCRN